MKNGLAIAVCGASALAAVGAVREGLNASVALGLLIAIWWLVQYRLWPQGLHLIRRTLPQIHANLQRSPIPPLVIAIHTAIFIMCVSLTVLAFR